LKNSFKFKTKKELRKFILERDNYICRTCGREVLQLEDPGLLPHIHHKDDNRDNNDLDNLETLCSRCHSLTRRVYIVPSPLPTGRSALSVAKGLGISKNTLYRWIRDETAQVVKLPNGRFIVSEKEVQRLKELLSGKAVSP